MKRVQNLSAKVAKRKDDRKRKITKLAVIIVTITFLLVDTSMNYYRIRATHAPNWANFNSTPFVGEIVQSKNLINGVPDELTINGERWDVLQVDNFDDVISTLPQSDFNGVMAETYCDVKLIAYIPTEDINQLKMNLMHEIYHAGACLHKEGDSWWNSPHPDSPNHPGIYHLGEFTATFLHDNPAFAVWLINDSTATLTPEGNYVK